ncbi:helix-turn-helix domain-containing protein [Spirosoma sp. KUDC1026]|uniref:helix-turn-helix domain-containing protein n=1 Tax=Spirosoma sp. KUDC1026 TaxID=2745947 RepID=UPI00159BECCE|nr:helix-turn-helix domain-containing protein [Spirosoma sp. KUDC1026]QKZ14527.1 AraC family transcriptional regulator [Spirosoma sp. KUDC1026]
MPIPHKLLSRKDEITADFLKLLNEHFDNLLSGRTDQMFHSRDFAERLFIHPTHLGNTIKLTMGKSPCDLMEERMVEEAQKMLLTTNMSVAEIGNRLTYSESTNFIKFFKSMTGTTPLRYRKQHLSELQDRLPQDRLPQTILQSELVLA